METKVTVNIYGQGYTIMGDKSEEEILKIAEYVDEQMKFIGKNMINKSTASLAVLTAINIAEQYFDVLKWKQEYAAEKERLEQESAYYMDMWEKSKDSGQQSKKSVTDLKERIKEGDDALKELRDKCTEYENNFFDLQMENIQLKSELEKLKNK